MNGTSKVLRQLILASSFLSIGATAQIKVARSVKSEKAKAITAEIQELREDFEKLYRKKDWDNAIEVGLRLSKLAPQRGAHAYDLACVYALSNHPDEAAQWLVESATNGFKNIRHLTSDTDLESIRTHPGYEKAVAAVKKNHDKSIAFLKELFKETTIRIVKPPHYDKDTPVPLIVALHGYGGAAKGMAGAWRKSAAKIGALLVAPQAVHPGPGVGYSWTGEDRMSADEAEQLVRWTVDLVLRDYKIDKTRMILTGFSQGGFVSLAVGPRHPYAFTGVIPMAGGYIRALDAPEKATGDNPPRFYFMVGAKDRPVEQMRQASADFAEAGFKTKLRIYPKVGHTFPINPEEELKQALDFVLAR